MKRPVRSGDEQDAVTGWRRLVFWQRGELARIKRQIRRRERQEAKDKIRRGEE